LRIEQVQIWLPFLVWKARIGILVDLLPEEWPRNTGALEIYRIQPSVIDDQIPLDFCAWQPHRSLGAEPVTQENVARHLDAVGAQGVPSRIRIFIGFRILECSACSLQIAPD